MTERAKITRSIERANQLVRRHLAERLDQLGITEIEAHLLARLGAKGPLSVGDLHAAFGLRRSTLTNALDRLERRGLLLRAVDPDDRRTFRLMLTQAGRRASRRVVALVDDLEARVATRVSRADVEAFHAVIAALEESLR